jgi:DNA-binding CsgD family transcriptional regulator
MQGQSALHSKFALTQREIEILSLVAGGHTNSQVASTLHISRHTVAQHIADMLHRAEARNRGELVARAYSAGILATGIWPPQARTRTAG